MKRVALVFPGQGSQYVGMGKNMYDMFTSARQIFQQANDILGMDLTKLCFEGDIKELSRTYNAQPAILTASVAAFQVYMQEVGISPVISAGHSLGEFSALTCTGAIRFEDALRIVRKRGLLMESIGENIDSTMAAVIGINKAIVEEVCAEYDPKGINVRISNYNAQEQVVLSGIKEDVSAVVEKLKGYRGKVVYLKVNAPFHTPLMAKIEEELEEEMMKYTYYPFEWPIISNVDAKSYIEPDKIIKVMRNQVSQPVQWEKIMTYINRIGVNEIVELGPRSVLKKLAKANAFKGNALAYDEKDDFKSLCMRGQEDVSNNKSLLEHINCALMIVVSSRNNNQKDSINEEKIAPIYKRLKEIKDQVESSTPVKYADEVIEEIIYLLQNMFTYKDTDEMSREIFMNLLEDRKRNYYNSEID